MLLYHNQAPRESKQERTALHSTIWKISNDLRGTLDGWDFKQYVLGMLFYRFISENIVSYINKKQWEEGEKSFNYSKLEDHEVEFYRELVLEEKGFFIYPSELFDNVNKQSTSNNNLNETLKTVFNNIETSAKGTCSEDCVVGLFDDMDLNSNRLGATIDRRNELLVKLMKAIGDFNLGNYDDNSIDVFGDAYEYLMTMYAANAGKSGGEFFTPQEVAELLAQITVVGKTKVSNVYDPTCGSGSLLLKFAKVLGKENVLNGFYGQESNITTYNLCRINMFLHNINYAKFNIAHGDTLVNPKHRNIGNFEAIVSNPPYSIKWDGDTNPLLMNDARFVPAGTLAPKSKADLAFVMHILSCLAPNGTAAIVCFPGVMYRGGAEQKIRKYLIDNNFVDAVIQLPPDLFFGTTIATCILVLKKNKTDNKVLFIDGTAEFVRESSKNKMTIVNSKKILDCYESRQNGEYFSRLVDYNEIVEKEYTINVNSYVLQKDTKEIVDIKELNEHIAQIVKRQTELRSQIDAIVADLEGKTI
jgi:type I restriction enzyme M protein